jgi:hypothetical protein
MPYLVAGPQATDFLEMAQIDSGLKAMLGNPDKCDATVAPEIRSAHIAMRNAVQKVAALSRDVTRTDVDKHAAAKRLATSLQDKLSQVKKSIVTRADQLHDDAMRQANLDLGPKADRAAIHSEIRGWISQVTTKPDGMQKVRAAMKEGSEDLAAVLWHSPHFLLSGLPAETFDELKMEALQSAKPELYGMLSASVGLRKIATSYDTAIRKVSVSFYNHVLAEQANKRVEV